MSSKPPKTPIKSPSKAAPKSHGLSRSPARSPTRSPARSPAGRRRIRKGTKKEAEKPPEEVKVEEKAPVPLGPVPPLAQAAREGNVAAMRELITAQPIDRRLEYVNEVDSQGLSALFSCLQPDDQYVEAMTLLLDYGADPNLRDNERHTPLHRACEAELKKHVRLLVCYGADILAENHEHNRPHQMLPDIGEVERAQGIIGPRGGMQSYLNACVELYKERIAEKKLFNVPTTVRCYYRSLFDLLDPAGTGTVPYSALPPLLDLAGGTQGGPELSKPVLSFGLPPPTLPSGVSLDGPSWSAVRAVLLGTNTAKKKKPA